ncbi:MAG TPA: hypothetical protein VLC12_07280, partial [Terriglobales bacterium]|nr:hypothetical protein [Terriglobales bacterium]
MFKNLPIPARIPILYLIMSVLLLVSVVPMYFYSQQMISMNRDRLKTNEMMLQNTITRSLADNIFERQSTVRLMLNNLSSAIQIASGGDLSGNHVSAPELRALVENFVSSSDNLVYSTLLNSQAKGISAGRIAPDAFLQRELERSFSAARDGRIYNGDALTAYGGKTPRTIMLI